MTNQREIYSQIVECLRLASSSEGRLAANFSTSFENSAMSPLPERDTSNIFEIHSQALPICAGLLTDHRSAPLAQEQGKRPHRARPSNCSFGIFVMEKNEIGPSTMVSNVRLEI